MNIAKRITYNIYSICLLYWKLVTILHFGMPIIMPAVYTLLICMREHLSKTRSSCCLSKEKMNCNTEGVLY